VSPFSSTGTYRYRWTWDVTNRKTMVPSILNYYVWTPIFFLSQAILFAVLFPIETYLYNRSSLAIRHIVENARAIKTCFFPRARRELSSTICEKVDSYLNQTEKDCGVCVSVKDMVYRSDVRQTANYNTTVFITLKLLHLFNSALQFWMVCLFLGQGHNPLFGVDVLRSLHQSNNNNTDIMPLVTLCDVPLKRLGNLHMYSIQCVLPQNLFNRAVFTFLWVWYIHLFICNLFSLLRWTVNLYLMKSDFLENILCEANSRADRPVYLYPSDSLFRSFVSYLAQDGQLVFRLLLEAVGPLLTRDLLRGVFERYRRGRLSFVADWNCTGSDTIGLRRRNYNRETV
jgi:hypothetical protein